MTYAQQLSICTSLLRSRLNLKFLISPTSHQCRQYKVDEPGVWRAISSVGTWKLQVDACI
eukprot:2569279-Amphidinium_carterae.1